MTNDRLIDRLRSLAKLDNLADEHYETIDQAIEALHRANIQATDDCPVCDGIDPTCQQPCKPVEQTVGFAFNWDEWLKGAKTGDEFQATVAVREDGSYALSGPLLRRAVTKTVTDNQCDGLIHALDLTDEIPSDKARAVIRRWLAWLDAHEPTAPLPINKQMIGPYQAGGVEGLQGLASVVNNTPHFAELILHRVPENRNGDVHR